MPSLVFTKSDGGAIRLPLRRGQVSIGRKADCVITLEGPQVSRLHAVIVYQEGYYHLRDQSKNGTWVNDRGVKEARLKQGDRITIGEWNLEFVDDAAAAEPETVTSADPALAKKGGGWAVDLGLVGHSKKMQELFKLLQKVAAADTSVLILGETGTGKELVAQAIHHFSKSPLLPFVPVNCAAISPQLVESELFGHERGAFTGAIDRHPGAFEQARGGTLFLDEVGELSLDVQSKLLRALEAKKLRRVGGEEEIAVKCRVVAATHRNLPEEVKKGSFREDLYYRLYVMPIEIPPLRQRREDIPLLVDFFLDQMRPGLPPSITEPALAKLQNHFWPGNVRELKNVMLRAALIASDQTIGPEQIVFLPHAISEENREPRTIDAMEKEMILKVLKETSGNKAAAARQLGIATSTIFKKIKEYGITEG